MPRKLADSYGMSYSDMERVYQKLGQTLESPEYIRERLAACRTAEIGILNALISLNGQARPSRVYKEVRHLVRPHDGLGEINFDYTGTPRFNDACARLISFGLVFTPSYELLVYGPKQRLFIPDTILRVLRTDARCRELLAHPAPPAPSAKPEVTSTNSVEDFQRDLSRYLRHVRKQGTIALTTQEWIYKTNFRSFLAALNLTPAPQRDGQRDAAQGTVRDGARGAEGRGNEGTGGDEESNPRLWFMRRLLTAMGELTVTGAGFTANEKSRLLSMPLAERVKHAFEVWNNTGAWDELNRVPYPHGGYSKHAPAPAGVSRAHGAVLRGIVKLANTGHGTPGAPVNAERWLGATQLVDQIWRNDYDFLIKRPNETRSNQYDDPYTNDYEYYEVDRTLYFEGVPNEAQGWDVVERQFILNVIQEPLYWMGLVELGFTKGDTSETVAFRLTPAGAWLLGLGKQPEFIESGGRVLVQPNFTVLAMEPVSDAVLLALDDFALSQGGDRAITYSLTRQSVYQGQRKGWTAQSISAFLAQHQGGPIPLNVQRTLEEWQALYGRITFHRSATVLHYADETAGDSAREVLASNHIRLRALAPTFDIVSTGDQKPRSFEQISSALGDAGWMPLLTTSAETQQAAGTLHIDAAGEVTFKQSVPNIFALSKLEPLAERQGNKGGAPVYRITARRVRDALSQGKTVEEVLSLLAGLNDGPLPAGLETAVREWANYFGDATLANVCLLELSNRQVLERLLDDKEAGKYLKEVKGSLAPLAVVQADKVERVRALLAERGLNLHE
jgi:hypothetical protein